MRAQVKSKANALIAAIMAAIFAFSLSGVPASALAAPEGKASAPTVEGVDFLQTQAEGWELLKVNNLGDQAIYITVKKDDKPLSNPIKYTADMNNGVSNSGTGEQIAQLIALQIFDNVDSQEAKEAKTVNELFNDPNNHAKYTVEVSTALMGVDPFFKGTIYPVYAQVGDDDEMVLLGVRTASNPEATKNLGVGETYYKQADGEEYATTYSLVKNGECDNAYDSALGAYVVTYKEVGQGTVEGQIRYVDTEGTLIKAVPVSGIGKDGKEVGIMESFTTAEGEGDNATITYWRTISALGGKTVKLTSTNASYTVTVMEVEGMDKSSYTVTIKYVDEHDNLLWSDKVDVKGYGYRYTLPNLFSVNQYEEKEDSPNYHYEEGVNFYTLDKVVGGQVVQDEQAAGTEEIITQEDESTNAGTTPQPSTTAIVAEDSNGTALKFTKDMTDPDFIMEGKERVVKAVYKSQEATAEVKFTLVEIDGETGQELARVISNIKPDQKFSYTPEPKEIDGKKYVPWAGNTEEIVYTWESLGQSVDLLQYVYYVPEDYVPGDAYDVTVQYVNVANGSVIQTQTVNIDPEITNFVNISGPQTLTQGGEEYVRLAGQDTAIRHAFLSPNRTYTIYYRNVNDTINANTIIDRVQIIQTTQPGTGGGLTAAPVAVEGDPGVDAGVGAGDGTVIINDDDNPLANLDGQDTTTERTIAENENPLASGVMQNGFVIAACVIGAIALIGLVAYFLLRRRNKANDKQNA